MIELLDHTISMERITKIGYPLEGKVDGKVGKGLYIWRRGGVWLYIGISRSGTCRILEHDLINPRTFLPTDTCIFFFLDLEWGQIKNLENKLIRKYKPIHNKQCNPEYRYELHRLFLTHLPKVKIRKRLHPLHPCPVDGHSVGNLFNLYENCDYCDIKVRCEDSYKRILKHNSTQHP